MYDDIDSYHLQHTPPASPYHESGWELKLDQVGEALQHHKEKKLGYLELYFQGFMEFVDDTLPSPEMSDDEEEYPRWGSFSTSREKASTSSAASVVSHDDLAASITSDVDNHICATPERMASPERDSKAHHDLASAISSHHHVRLSRRYPRRPTKHFRKYPPSARLHAVSGKPRINKEHSRRSRSRSRGKTGNGIQT